MPTLHDIQLFCFGSAAVIDTAVLMTLVEGRNRRRVVLPLGLLAFGAWLFHAGVFGHAMVWSGGAWSHGPRILAMTMVAGGLLLLPSAMLQATLFQRGIGMRDPETGSWWHALAYLPVLLLIPLFLAFRAEPAGSFLHLVSPILLPYGLWILGVAAGAAITLVQAARTSESAGLRRLFRVGAAAVVLQALLHVLGPLIIFARPELEGIVFIPCVLATTGLILVVGWAVVRYNLLRIVLRRAAIYAVIVVAVLLFDRTLIAEHRIALSSRLGVDFEIVEGTVLIALLLFWGPARRRIADALPYLLGEPSRSHREATRRLALHLSALSGSSARELVSWFGLELARALDAKWCGVWLFRDDGDPAMGEGDHEVLANEDLARLREELDAEDTRAWRLDELITSPLEALVRRREIGLVVRIRQPGIDGIIVLGRRRRLREYTDEQLSNLLLLAEHLGVALNNTRLQAERLSAERRAQDQQRLSMIGLVASSIAHEVKNPLSSIKTLVSVLEEETEGRAAEDLRLVRREVDRLGERVTGLLRFARPSTGSSQSATEEVIDTTLRLLGHRARKDGVELRSQIEESLPVIGSDDALREILFNLLTNAIEAAGRGGWVKLRACSRDGGLEVVVEDSGPGLAPEIQDRLFEAFATTRPEGTGLGLYIVGQRTRELEGQVECDTAAEGGTRFELFLPGKREQEG